MQCFVILIYCFSYETAIAEGNIFTHLLKPSLDQVVLLISPIRIDFGKKREVDKQWRLVPILDEVHCLGGIGQGVKLLLCRCVEEWSNFWITFRLLPLRFPLRAKKLRLSNIFHPLPSPCPFQPGQLKYPLLLLLRVHVCLISNIKAVESVKASLGRGVRVGAKAQVPLSKPMGAVSEDVFKVIKEARHEEVDCLPLVLEQLWEKI